MPLNFSVNSGRPQIKDTGTQWSTGSFTTKGDHFPGPTVPLNTLNLCKGLDLLKVLNTERPERWVVSISVSKKTSNPVSKSECWQLWRQGPSHHASPAIGESRAPAGLSATLQWPLGWAAMQAGTSGSPIGVTAKNSLILTSLLVLHLLKLLTGHQPTCIQLSAFPAQYFA